MNFKSATNEQLIEIAHCDNEANWVYKVAALAELMRREGEESYGKV